MDVVDHGTAGVGLVGHMDLAAGQVPDQPGVDGTEGQLAPLGPLTGAGNVVQQPCDLGAGEVGIGHQTGLAADHIAVACGHQLVDHVGGTAALPDDGVEDGFAGGAVPDHGSLTLVGDTDGGDAVGFHIQLLHGVLGDFQSGAPDLRGVMLHPAGLGEDLPEFLLSGGTDVASLVKENTAGRGCALIQGHDVFHSQFLLSWGNGCVFLPFLYI